MSLLDEIKSKADLRRWLTQELRSPDVLPPRPQPGLALVKSGAPSDSDFPGKPGNGLLALDVGGIAPVLYARVDGAWVEVA